MNKKSEKKAYTFDHQKADIYLDANESENYLFKDGFKLEAGSINRYPDHRANALKDALASYHDMASASLMLGSGSSELLELIIKTFVNPGEVVLGIEPSFTMYEVYSDMHHATYRTLEVDDKLQVDEKRFIETMKRLNPVLTILCTPNNPTGQTLSDDFIFRVINETKGLVLLDEAYVDFEDAQASWLAKAPGLQNVFVTRTFSKAFGLAGARLGYLSTNPVLMAKLWLVKTPYSISRLSQAIGTRALQEKQKVLAHISGVKKRRETLAEALRGMNFTVYPSKANFLFVRSPIPGLGDALIEKGIKIRNFASYRPDFYRISVGNAYEIKRLLEALKEVMS